MIYEEMGLQSRLLSLGSTILLFLLLGQLVMSPISAFSGSGANDSQPNGLSGRQVDVFTQSGGEGPSIPDGFFGPDDAVYLFANVSYNDWPVVGVMVAFEVRTANDTVFTASGVVSNENGTAAMNLRLPRPEALTEPLYGNWTVTATATIAEVMVNDTVQFKLLHLIPGDVNHDYVVDIIDLTIVALAFSSRPDQPNWNFRADINRDDVVNIIDLVTVAIHLNEKSW